MWTPPHRSSSVAGLRSTGPVSAWVARVWLGGAPLSFVGPSARRVGVSCDCWDPLFRLVTGESGRNTPGSCALAHLVWPGLGFPYI
jgi:hypothetical protein